MMIFSCMLAPVQFRESLTRKLTTTYTLVIILVHYFMWIVTFSHSSLLLIHDLGSKKGKVKKKERERKKEENKNETELLRELSLQYTKNTTFLYTSFVNGTCAFFTHSGFTHDYEAMEKKSLLNFMNEKINRAVRQTMREQVVDIADSFLTLQTSNVCLHNNSHVEKKNGT